MGEAFTEGVTIFAMLEGNAARFGSRAAILGEDGVQLSHGELLARVGAIVLALKKVGIGRGDRVAVVLPPGPDLAVAFLAAAAWATSAPLNPAYLEKEFEFNLQDLSARR